MTFKLEDEEVLAALEKMAAERSKSESKTGKDAYSRNTLARALVLDAVARWEAGTEATETPPRSSMKLDDVLRAIQEVDGTVKVNLDQAREETNEQLDRIAKDVLGVRRAIAVVFANILKELAPLLTDDKRKRFSSDEAIERLVMQAMKPKGE